jgi:hypothetical protein
LVAEPARQYDKGQSAHFKPKSDQQFFWGAGFTDSGDVSESSSFCLFVFAAYQERQKLELSLT